MYQKIFKPALAFSIILIAIVICELTTPHGARYSLEYFLFNYIPFLLLSLLLFSITNRSVFASCLSSIVVIAFVAVSNIKYSVLEVPLIPSDFMLAGYFRDNPHLYLQYLNTNSFLFITLSFLCVALVYKFEGKQFVTTRHVVVARVIIAALTLTFFTNVTGADSFVAKTYSSSSLHYYSWDPRSSVRHSGLFNTFIRMSEGMDFTIPDAYGDTALIEKVAAQHPVTKPAALPDIVVVQSESFYDLRHHELQIDKRVYAGYDQAATRAAVSGNLRVQTVGGNTAKTEFSFLTGIESSILPSGCEYPYRFLVNKNIWSIAWHLRSLGYTTIAIHPHTRTFWDRNIALEFLGFDQFIDDTHFSVSQREGLYVSDQAVADKIATTRKNVKSPLFIFAITMENHGPWDKRRVAKRRKLALKGSINPADRKKVARYLHHAANAGDMALTLTKQLEKSARPCVLAFYGDHAPGFGEGLYKVPLKPGRTITETPYFVWKNFGVPVHSARDISVSFLASEVLDQAEINNDLYFQANSYIKTANKGIFNHQSNDLNRSYTQLLYNNLSGKLSHVHFTSKKML